jgi:hypothetical protein
VTVPSRACVLGYSRRCKQGNASLLLFKHLCSVKLYHVQVDTLFGRMKSSKSHLQVSQCFTMPIILFVVPVGMISKNISSLTSQNVMYSNLLAEAAVLKFSVLLILFLSVKNFHSLTKVDRKHVVFRQEILLLYAVSSAVTYCCYGLRGYWHDAKPFCSRSLKFSPWSEKVSRTECSSVCSYTCVSLK